MFRIGFLLLFLLIFLFGCSNKFVEEAKESQAIGAGSTDEREEEALQKKNEQLLKEMEKPIEESLHENDLDEMQVLENKNDVETKNSYTEEDTFAKYVGQTLFQFQNLSLDPLEFYAFLINHGSKKTLEETAKTEEEAKTIFTNIQSLYQQSENKLNSYQLSNVKLNTNKMEGYFYRKVSSSKGEEYYITTIVKENGNWKFSEDSPSPPFIIEQILTEGESQ